MIDPENVMYSFFDKTFCIRVIINFSVFLGYHYKGIILTQTHRLHRQTAVNGVSLSTTHISPTIR